ncbi:hypothetical protein Hanom_Chr16g01432611 [Helianthus anomalus]
MLNSILILQLSSSLSFSFFSDYGFLTNPFTVTMEKSESVVAKTRGERRFRLVGR